MVGRKIPTISGVLLIITVVISGITITSYIKHKDAGLSENIAPKDIRISNVSDSSFNISWITKTKATGIIKWSSTPSNLNEEIEDSIKNPSYTHSVKIENVSPATTYYFAILSNGRLFDNNNIPWQVSTAQTESSKEKAKVISGSVYDQFNLPVEDALVYVTVAGSAFLSTTTSENGSWIISTSEARTQNLESFTVIDEQNSLVEIFIQAGPPGNASAQIYPLSARPAPPIILGQTYNFKVTNPNTEQSPKAEVNLPEGGFKNPSFLIPD
jgi:hypothetical protein